jgi:hypothetical protein
MKHAVGSGAMINVPGFYLDYFRHSDIDREDIPTHRQHSDIISLFLFF